MNKTTAVEIKPIWKKAYVHKIDRDAVVIQYGPGSNHVICRSIAQAKAICEKNGLVYKRWPKWDV